MKIGYLTMEKYENRKRDSVGSSRIRGRWVMKYCPEIEEFVDGRHYDAVIYQKAYYKEHMDAFKGIKIFDICDPDWMDNRPITELAEVVDGFTVSTPAMKEYLDRLIDKPVMLIPDRIDPDDHTPVKEEHVGKARSVVWFGYSQNHIVLDKTINVLRSLLLQLVVISDRNYADADVNIPWNYSTLNEEIVKHDIILMPDFKSNLRHSYKSNNKTLTSWALKMPVATTPEDLEKFMDPVARQTEVDMRYNEVMTKWHVKDSGPQYLEFIKQLQEIKLKGGEH